MPRIKRVADRNLRAAGWYASNLSQWWPSSQRRPDMNVAAGMCAEAAGVSLVVARGMLEYIMMPELESVTMERIDQGDPVGARGDR